MEARPIDTRDTKWQLDSPLYRVYFWERKNDGGYWWTVRAGRIACPKGASPRFKPPRGTNRRVKGSFARVKPRNRGLVRSSPCMGDEQVIAVSELGEASAAHRGLKCSRPNFPS